MTLRPISTASKLDQNGLIYTGDVSALLTSRCLESFFLRYAKCALMSVRASSRMPSVDIHAHAKKSGFKCHVDVCVHVCNEPKLVRNYLPRRFRWNDLIRIDGA